MPRSTNYGELNEPYTKGKDYGPQSFHAAAATVWNSLLKHFDNSFVN